MIVTADDLLAGGFPVLVSVLSILLAIALFMDAAR